MMCAWKELLGILPPWMRSPVDSLGRRSMRELRLRINAPPEVVLKEKSCFLDRNVSQEDIQFCLNTASRYSPWTASTCAKGYLTAPGGHRIGLCGSAVYHDGTIGGIRQVQSLCIRVARDHPGIADRAASCTGSTLILGAPGWGKTTLLRDLCRQISSHHQVSVMDERGELFPNGIPRGKRMDVLTGCPKPLGLDMLLRTMGPEYIALDEITAPEDCEALIHAANCGVFLLATAHASSLAQYRKRAVYAPLVQQNLFSTLLVLHKDQSYTLERMDVCN